MAGLHHPYSLYAAEVIREPMTRSARLEVPGYQVVEYLGSGARSTIWRIRERDTGKYFALKRVFKQPGDDGRFLEQAENEFQVAGQFNHPGIRHYYKLRHIRKWLQVQELHLYMELCEGSSCQAKRPTDIAEVVRIFIEVGEAIAYMHSCGYVHADMKPNNIIVASDGSVKIIDFGQSCRVGTIKERIQGTPDFIAPEQVRLKPLDHRTDIFNFGATLYWVLTGKPIPTILPKEESIQRMDDIRVTSPDLLNEKVPPNLAKLVLDCVAMHPSQRPERIKEVVLKLDLITHSLKPSEPADGSSDH